VGAGSAFTTVTDLLRFFRAMDGGPLLTRSARDSLFGTSESAFGQRRIYLGGRAPSYTASIQLYPEELLIVALGNNYARLNEEITDGIAGLIFGRWTDERIGGILRRELQIADVRVPADELRRLVGRYRHAWGFEFHLELEGDRLVYVDAEHGTRSPLTPAGDRLFVSPFQWAELRTSDSEMTWRWLDFPGKDWTVERIETPPSSSR
jgi:hypothetical protein